MAQVDELKTAAKGDGPGTDGQRPESSKVEFTSEQQAKVQHLIDDAYKRAFVKAAKNGGASEEMDRLLGEVDSLREDKKTASMLRVIARHNVVDSDEVAQLLSGHVRLDETGNLTVVGGAGSERINSSGHPMGFEEYIERWLSDRPHHLRSPGGMGSGSQGARFSGEARTSYNLSDPAVWRTMPRQELERLMKEGVNVQGAGGQVFKFKEVKNPFVDARKRKFNSGG